MPELSKRNYCDRWKPTVRWYHRNCKLFMYAFEILYWWSFFSRCNVRSWRSVEEKRDRQVIVWNRATLVGERLTICSIQIMKNNGYIKSQWRKYDVARATYYNTTLNHYVISNCRTHKLCSALINTTTSVTSMYCCLLNLNTKRWSSWIWFNCLFHFKIKFQNINV